VKRIRRGVVAILQPRVQLTANAVAAAVWLVLFAPGLLSWRESVPFLVTCSIYANLAGHLSAVAAAAGARKADSGDDL